MDKSLLMFAGGIRSATKTLADGNEHTLYFKAKTPSEIALYAGSERRLEETPAGDILREKTRANFLASSLCNEAGELLMTEAEAMLIPATLKPELCSMVMKGSNETSVTGKA